MFTKFKLYLLAAAIAGAFFAGFKVAAWRADAALTDAHQQANEELTAALHQERIRSRAAVEAERERAKAHAETIAALEASSASLREEIDNARFETPPVVDANGVLACPDPLGSGDFIRLWNEAARSGAGPTAPR